MLFGGMFLGGPVILNLRRRLWISRDGETHENPLKRIKDRTLSPELPR